MQIVDTEEECAIFSCCGQAGLQKSIWTLGVIFRVLDWGLRPAQIGQNESVPFTSPNHEIQEKKINKICEFQPCLRCKDLSVAFLQTPPLYPFSSAFNNAHFNYVSKNIFSPIFLHWSQRL